MLAYTQVSNDSLMTLHTKIEEEEAENNKNKNKQQGKSIAGC